MIKGAPIDVRSYGAVCDGVTDDTAAVQAAIDAAIANNTGVLVNGTCRLTASLKIDRLVDTATENVWFVVYSDNGGGFYVDTPITILDTNFNYTTAPKTSQVFFQNLRFEVSSPSINAYVISAGYLRTAFSGCSFRKIKFFAGAPPTSWSQSIYLDKCVARSWSGIFFNNTTETYDLKVNQCLIEANQPVGGVGAFNLGTSNMCSFTDNVIEGIYGYCIRYAGGNGLSIIGNYFEKDTGPEIDGTPTDGTPFALGVSIIGNHFENTDITKPFCIGWSGYTRGGFSSGNGAAGGNTTLHSLPEPGSEALITIGNDGCSAGTILSNYPARTYFIDRQYPAKGGYVYGRSTDADAVDLVLGTHYAPGSELDMLQLSHLNKIVFNQVNYVPAFVNLKSDGTTRQGFCVKNIDSGNSTTYGLFVNSANAAAGAITQTGATTVNYGTSSDYRLKENVQPISNALDKVMRLNPVTFTWKSDGSSGQGFIAHELQAEIPQAVSGKKDDVWLEEVVVEKAVLGNDGYVVKPAITKTVETPKYQAVDASHVVATLVAAIKELKEELDALKRSN